MRPLVREQNGKCGEAKRLKRLRN